MTRLLFLGVLFAGALQEKKAFTDAESAGPDFQVQGDYEGGAQVVARGDGAFDVILAGGRKLAAKREGDEVRVEGGAIAGGLLKLDSGGPTQKLVIRKSPAEGAKPPEGAIILFDGKSADAWEKGKVVEGNLLYCGTKTKRLFRDLRLHVEFRLCYGPRWPDRSNSGVYLGGRHEVQIFDSFGVAKPGPGDCGGIYGTAGPKVNLCFPPLSWQTYDIEYRMQRYEGGKKVANARLTVDHNGVRIHDAVEVAKETTASILKEADEPGPIHLQDHGSPVVFRNIWAAELK